MASDASFVQFVVDQVSGAGAITTRFMFGDYALYCNEKVVALICDNKLFVKPTAGGRAFIGTPVEAPAYTGAKPSFLIEEKLEDRTWLTDLIRITEKEVAAPVKKKDAKKVVRKTVKKVAKKAVKSTAKKTAKPKAKKKTTRK
jgi:TfoX/Sxy family transcriptional regulator of competence genes